MNLSKAFDGLLAGLGETFLNMLMSSPKQFDSVLQVAHRNTEFIDSPAMQRSLEASNFRISDLKTSRKGLSFYLSLPQRYMATHYRWLRMVIALTVTEMEIVKGLPATGHRVLLVLDEFAGLRRMEVIENAVAQIAGFGVKLFFVLQSLEQLKATYKDNWETFLANSGLKLFFGLEDHFSREYVSKLLGETEIVREVQSSSDSLSESHTISETHSKSESQSHSVGRSVSHGTSESVSRTTSSGTSESLSDTRGGSRGRSMPRGAGSANTSISDGVNWSRGRTWGRSTGTSVSRTHGHSSTQSTSVTDGTSVTTGTTTGTTQGVTTGRTTGSSETIHRRALISPDEIGAAFRRVDDHDDPAYPGLALVVVSGARPMIVRRVNYFEDYQFIRRFDPHPDHPFRPAREYALDFPDTCRDPVEAEKLAILRYHVVPGAIVAEGDAVAALRLAIPPAEPVTLDIAIPFAGRIHAHRSTFPRPSVEVDIEDAAPSHAALVDRLSEIDDAWHATTTGVEFVGALAERGFVVARGGRRVYVVVDARGAAHVLWRQIRGAKSRDIRNRLADCSEELIPDIRDAAPVPQLQDAPAAEEPTAPARDGILSLLTYDQRAIEPFDPFASLHEAIARAQQPVQKPPSEPLWPNRIFAAWGAAAFLVTRCASQ